jgi:hypothetical protein
MSEHQGFENATVFAATVLFRIRKNVRVFRVPIIILELTFHVIFGVSEIELIVQSYPDFKIFSKLLAESGSLNSIHL